MKMVKSVYKKILENVPTHMPETGGMLGGQDGTVTKVVFDGGKDDDFRRCHYTPNVTCLLYTSPSPRDMRRSRMPSSA